MTQETSRKDYKSYEYKQVAAKENQTSFLIDCYENLGWVLDENAPIRSDRGQSHIQLKRDRKITNKTELTRLERHFEACLSELDELERSKTSRPTMAALICALIGTIFLAGATFAVTAEPPIVWLCVVLAIPGSLGWILPYFLYRRGVAKQTEKVTPFMEKKYDEIDEICKKGHSLL